MSQPLTTPTTAVCLTNRENIFPKYTLWKISRGQGGPQFRRQTGVTFGDSELPQVCSCCKSCVLGVHSHKAPARPLKILQQTGSDRGSGGRRLYCQQRLVGIPRGKRELAITEPLCARPFIGCFSPRRKLATQSPPFTAQPTGALRGQATPSTPHSKEAAGPELITSDYMNHSCVTNCLLILLTKCAVHSLGSLTDAFGPHVMSPHSLWGPAPFLSS